MKPVPDALATPGYRWRHTSTEHAEVYVLEGSRAETVAAELSASTEAGISSALAYLGEPFSGSKLNVLLVGRDSELVPITGGLSYGESDPEHGSTYLVGNDSMKPPLSHEIMHLLSWRVWGPPARTWMSEGVATLAMRECGGYPITSIAAELRREGKLVPLDSLWNDFSLDWEKGAIDYVEAASLLEYVDRVYGRKSVRALWRTDRSVDVRNVLGVDLPRLEREWNESLSHESPSAPWNTIFPVIAEKGCGT